jgi:transposase
MRVTDTTLLWSLHRVKTPAVGQVRVVGIDDWSWRRGQRYGSILVNLETHTIIDLLPERTVESVIAWLEAHPEVEVVSGPVSRRGIWDVAARAFCTLLWERLD